MKCAIVSSFMGPYYSNYVASMIALEKAMQNHGHKTFYIFPKQIENYGWVKKLKAVNKNLFFIDYAPWKFSNFKQLRAILKKENTELIYTRMGGWDVTARFAMPFSPVVWHIDMGINLTSRIKWIKNWIKYKILALWNTHLIEVSAPAADALNILSPRFPCVAIPNAIDISRLRIRNGTREGASSVKNLLIFAYSPINKGLDITLDSLEKLNEGEIKFHLLISAQKHTYEYMANRYQELPSWVTLIPPTDDVAMLYSQADAMLIPSLSEGFSYCLAEAIYTGLPVICSDIPGNQWAHEFKKAFFFAKGNAAGLGRAIEEFARNTITCEEQKANRALLVEKYSLNVWTEKVVAFIESIRAK